MWRCSSAVTTKTPLTVFGDDAGTDQTAHAGADDEMAREWSRYEVAFHQLARAELGRHG
jgi:hypothetical protein